MTQAKKNTITNCILQYICPVTADICFDDNKISLDASKKNLPQYQTVFVGIAVMKWQQIQSKELY